jgi:DNA-binding transcriptional LysR family regulator
MNVELRQLKHAVAVAEHGNFARAALELHLSQSALSRSVQALEREVGTAIFLRSAAGVQLTDVGRQVLQHGQAMLQVAAELDRQIVRNRSLQAGQLRIGVATSTAEGAVADALSGLLVEHPMVAFEIRTAFRTDLIQPLRSGELDCLVADSTMFSGDHPEFDMEPLEEHPLVIVVRAGHPLVGRAGADVADIFAFPLLATGRLRPELLASLLDVQSRAQVPAAPARALPAVVCNSPLLAERMVLDSDTVAAFPPSWVADLVEAGRLVPLGAPQWLTSPFGIVSLKARAPSAAAQAFRERLPAAQSARAANDRRWLRLWLGPATTAP